MTGRSLCCMAAVSAVAPCLASPFASSFSCFYNNWELQVCDYKYWVCSVFNSIGINIANIIIVFVTIYSNLIWNIFLQSCIFSMYCISWTISIYHNNRDEAKLRSRCRSISSLPSLPMKKNNNKPDPYVFFLEHSAQRLESIILPILFKLVQ